MSDQANFQPKLNLEFFQKQAKSLLKRSRSLDPAALNRIRAALPRFVSLSDEHVATKVTLSDVQCALAHERGYTHWGELKQQTMTPRILPNFTKPGEDGELPSEFTHWPWSVTHTVQPELLIPVKCSQDYLICANILRRIAAGEKPWYEDLYRRAAAIAKARAAQLKCSAPDVDRHARILTHGWFIHDNSNLARAFITIAVGFLGKRASRQVGLHAPTVEDLAAPGGMTPENYTLQGAQVNRRVHEIYSDTDVRDPSLRDPNIFTFSYGEYASSSHFDYRAVVERAWDVAQFHFSLQNDRSGSRTNRLKLVRREWFCVTNPDIAVAHLYIQKQDPLDAFNSPSSIRHPPIE